jgi:DNA-binding response OmpR family regulator
MGNPKVLIIEDDADIRESLCLLLLKEGIDVLPAWGSEKGYEDLHLHRPDLIVADIMLPDSSGLELIRWVRQNPQFAELPIIAMTAYDEGYLLAAKELGANSVVHKPTGILNLVDEVKAILNTKTPRAVASEGQTPPLSL